MCKKCKKDEKDFVCDEHQKDGDDHKDEKKETL